MSDKEFKREIKYLVLKWDDIEKYLKQPDSMLKFDFVGFLCDCVEEGRRKDGKKPNTYVVVNEDEPYAEKVWQLIKEEWNKCKTKK